MNLEAPATAVCRKWTVETLLFIVLLGVPIRGPAVRKWSLPFALSPLLAALPAVLERGMRELVITLVKLPWRLHGLVFHILPA
jgi:hypothetical protein